MPGQDGRPGRRRPNVLFVLTDDHAAHAISAYGSRVNQTPQLDRIADGGVRMDGMYCTNSICTPSRASILTGTYSHVNGVTTLSTPIDNTMPTFPGLLREDGYRTALFGKWHLGEGAGHEPRGFDRWEVLRDQGEYHDPLFLSPDGERVRPGYATDVITDLALDWLGEEPAHAAGERPWCLLVHHKAPHRAWEPDDKHAGMYADPIPLPETFDDDYAGRGLAVHRARMRVAEDLTSEDLKQPVPPELDHEQAARWKYQRWMEDYLACIASVDDNVGRLLDRIEERGETEDTIVVYTSDQGFFLGDHGWFDKRFMFEESIRMPFLLRYPARVAAGGVDDRLSTNVDLARTLCDFAGVEPDAGMQGSSFAARVSERSEGLGPEPPLDPGAEEVYYRYYENDERWHQTTAHYGIRTRRWKLIYYYSDGMGLPGTSNRTFPPDWELYDLQRDPWELENLYRDPEHAEVCRELTARLARLQREVGDEPHPSQHS